MKFKYPGEKDFAKALLYGGLLGAAATDGWNELLVAGAIVGISGLEIGTRLYEFRENRLRFYSRNNAGF